MIAPVLSTRALFAGYGDVPIVHALDIDVAAGEVVALLGPNGAGKTTALLTIAGALPALGGQVLIDGAPTTSLLYQRARAGLALVTDDRAIFRELTVLENLRLGNGDPDEALRIFPALQRLRQRKAGLLSGGEQQMLGLGRALARRPTLLLVDELSLGLAPIIVQGLLRNIREAANAGAAVLLVEQQVRLVLQVADRAYVMNRGRVVLAGSSADLRKNSEQIERSYLAADFETSS